MSQEFELGTDGPTTILVGIDGSVTSMRAGAYAGGLARRQRALLVVVHVATVPALTALSPMPIPPDDALTEVTAELRRQVESAAAYAGIRVEFVAARGDPFTEIRRIATERRVDAVVVGSSTKAGHRIVGSLAVRLVRTGRWPVTVVP